MSALPPVVTPEGSSVSFSTNYEDVVLRRLFADRPDGFFVDVGAQHPHFGNDFYGLYARGWTGINIEPNPSCLALLREHRPRDQNLQLALAEVAGQDLVFFEVSDTGLSTCDEAQAAACLARGHTVRRHDVCTSTLRDVMAAADWRHVDVLKVDVEGLEEQVLLGNDWERCRPSIVMVEVTYLETALRRPTGIRDNLEALVYRHVYSDNLNDFFAEAGFVVPESAFLPPNVFDNFVRYEVLSLWEEALALRTSFSTASEYAHSLEAERGSSEIHGQALRAECASLQEAVGDLTRRTGVLAHKNAALRTHNIRLTGTAATARETLGIAVAAVLGQHDSVQALLARMSVTRPEQEERSLMPEQGRELVTIAGESVMDGARPAATLDLQPTDARAELMAAQLQSLDERHRRLLSEFDDLRHENRRLLASVRQTQGENMSLQRALGPAYATRDELHQLRDGIASLQVTIAERHRFLSADFDARVSDELNARLERLAGDDAITGTDLPGSGKESADTRLLKAMLASTSWRVTRPLRAFRRLFGA